MKRILLITLLIGTLGACTKYSKQLPEPLEAPPDLYSQAEKYILDRVGEDYYKLNFNYDSLMTSSQPEYEIYDDLTKQRIIIQKKNYYLVWVFRVFDKPYISNAIVFHITEDGVLINPGVLKLIPNCIEDIKNCEFPVTRKKAIELARAAGLEKGIYPYDTKVQWNRGKENEGYCWVVTMIDEILARSAYVNLTTEKVTFGEYSTSKCYLLKIH